MIRPKLVVVNSERDEQSRSIGDGKGFRFDLSRNKLIIYALSFVLSLCFMFTLGVFAGRGISMARPDDFSLKGRFLRFLGLDRETGGPSPKAAATWEDPRKMLESLNYYQDLTHEGDTPLGAASKATPAAVPKAAEPPPAVHPAERQKEAKLEVAPPRPARKPSHPQQQVKPLPAGVAGGRYTLLVASLREPDARALVDKLKADGYSPRIESLELGSAKWSRILLGSFPSREAALTFVGEFNRKEKLEALVMSGADQGKESKERK